MLDGGVLLHVFQVGEFVALEVAAGHQLQAHGIQRTFHGEVLRGVEVGAFLVGDQRQAGVPGVAPERQLVDRHCVLHPRNGTQRSQVFAGTGGGIDLLADAAQPHFQQLLFGNAAGLVDLLQALADQEQRVADDRAGQRDLQHDECGGGLVPAQRAQDGSDIHDVLRILTAI